MYTFINCFLIAQLFELKIFLFNFDSLYIYIYIFIYYYNMGSWFIIVYYGMSILRSDRSSSLDDIFSCWLTYAALAYKQHINRLQF